MTIGILAVGAGARVLLTRPSTALGAAREDLAATSGHQAGRVPDQRIGQRLIGHWKVDVDSAETRESLRRSALQMSEALQRLAGDSGIHGNYDADAFVANMLRTLAVLDVEFTPDTVVVTRGQDTKRIAYAILERKDNAVVLQMAAKSSFGPPGPMVVRFLTADDVQIAAASGESVTFQLHRKVGT